MQITVREVIKLLRDADCVRICHNGIVVVTYTKTSAEDVLLDAFGDYVVNEITASGEYEYELNLATRLVKAGDPA